MTRPAVGAPPALALRDASRYVQASLMPDDGLRIIKGLANGPARPREIAACVDHTLCNAHERRALWATGVRSCADVISEEPGSGRSLRIEHDAVAKEVRPHRDRRRRGRKRPIRAMLALALAVHAGIGAPIRRQRGGVEVGPVDALGDRGAAAGPGSIRPQRDICVRNQSACERHG